MPDTFGELLRRHRKDHDLSLEDLRLNLKAIGCEIESKSTISKWENGKTKPSSETIKDLEEVLTLPKGTLLRPAGYYVEGGEPDPAKVRLRQEHFSWLAGIANELLTCGLDNVIQIEPERLNSNQHPCGFFLLEYVICANGAYEKTTRERLTQLLLSNRCDVRECSHGFRALNCLDHHLAAESAELRSKGLEKAAETDPFHLIQTLQHLALSRNFKGTCPVCKDWA